MDADADREAFRRHVAESERLVKAGNGDAANAEGDNAETVARRWADRGELLDFLSPLLDESEAAAVRFDAACALLYGGHPDEGAATLEALRDGDNGVVSPEAEMVLDHWRRENAT
ncbi:MAG: hypothetical protein ACRDO1_14610 [Nocardioidaceae bacterium]